MKFTEFERSLEAPAPPATFHLALQALWWDAKGSWDKAHECVQADEGDPSCDWVHAYLHRKEGERPTPVTGIAAPESQFRRVRSRTNGARSSRP